MTNYMLPNLPIEIINYISMFDPNHRIKYRNCMREMMMREVRLGALLYNIPNREICYKDRRSLYKFANTIRGVYI
jgi:hypothetical protein